MDKREFPAQVVEISSSDHRPPIVSGRDDPKMFCEVTPELRQSLASQLESVSLHFQDKFNKWPEVPAVAKVTLREEALAKTHRPVNLFRDNTCPIIGTMDFGEILISATGESVGKLSDEILNNQSKTKLANISAIEKIEPYICDASFSSDSHIYKVRTFDHGSAYINEKINRELLLYAKELGIEIEMHHYGSRNSIFKVVSNSSEAPTGLTAFIGVQSFCEMPIYKPLDFELQTTKVGEISEVLLPPPEDEVDYPIVAVVDSGVCPNSSLIQPWVVGRESYVASERCDHTHGTMVAGLICGAYSLNQDERFPRAQAKILDVPVFEADDNLSEEFLVSVLESVIPKHPEVHVWNLSLGCSVPSSSHEFSDLACFLDEMHDEYGCLFIIAAGNHGHLQQWPQEFDLSEHDRVSSPGDCVRALTVGALANNHKDNSLSKNDEPSPFSRKGPGPCFIPKPEVTHYGGNCTSDGIYSQTGVLSIGPENSLCETIGTSFATPLVSAQAAALWSFLDNESSPCSAERVKALMVHSALINSTKVSSSTVNHYGFGKPAEIIDTLYCDPHSITMMFETDLRYGGYEFERWPFPFAECLHTEGSKFKGEILMTVVYSPVTDNRFKSEYCRTNVEVGMGDYRLEQDDNGEPKRTFKSVVPLAPKDVKQLFEKQQITHGFKWSPVKAYYNSFPRGTTIESWRLRMKVTRRAEEPMPDIAQRATLLITIRGGDKDLPVYNEAIQAMNQAGWITTNIDEHIDIRERIET